MEEKVDKKQEKEEVKNKKETPKDDLEKSKQQISFLEVENKKLKEEAESWKNKYYEAYADLANTRKSLEKDQQQILKYRASSFIEGILPALDSFQMAFKVDIKDPVTKNFATGFKMILNQIEQAMINEGVSFIEPKEGDKFDENTMHAIQVEKGEEDNLVTKLMARGYKLHDRLLRPAMVVVSKKEEVKNDENHKND